MNTITESVLIESRSARNSQISDVSNEHAIQTLDKAKAFVVAFWKNTGIATNAQLAEYYEVNIDAIESVLRRNREELFSDGVKVLTGIELKLVSVKMAETSNAKRLTAWTPRSALRLGLILQDSPVARKVRSVVLDIVEAANPVNSSKVLKTKDLTIHQLSCLRLALRLEASGKIRENILKDIPPIFWDLTIDAINRLSADIQLPESQHLDFYYHQYYQRLFSEGTIDSVRFNQVRDDMSIVSESNLSIVQSDRGRKEIQAFDDRINRLQLA